MCVCVYIYIDIDIYRYLILKKNIKKQQQAGIKVPKFSADAFLGGLFLTTERG